MTDAGFVPPFSPTLTQIRNNHPDQYKRMFAAAKAAYERRSKKYPTPCA